MCFTGNLMKCQGFSDFRDRYDHFGENDERAFVYIRPYIAKAKREGNHAELFLAYKDAISFSRNHKIEYADSAVWAASKTVDSDLQAMAFLTKGTVYYFNHRKFQPALDEYLKAWQYAETSQNKYLYYKNLYHIGVVKRYLGHYNEALEIFERCYLYFSKPLDSTELPNLKFNRIKGFLNTLDKMAICYINIGDFEKANELIDEGLLEIGSHTDFYLEKSYFFQSKGIMASLQNRSEEAFQLLENSLSGLEKKGDFTRAAISYFYLGQSLQISNNKDSAVKYFSKVDSVFQKHSFIHPEVLNAYEFIIKYYHQAQDYENELYFTKQLLKVDRIISEDYKYLATKIHKEYDLGELKKSKERLEKLFTTFNKKAWLAGVAALLFGILLYKRRDWSIKRKDAYGVQSSVIKSKNSNVRVPEEIATQVLKDLEKLEQECFYIQKGISLHKLAHKLKTNTTYLSVIINEYKGCSFSTYIKKLRIDYAVYKLKTDKKWRLFTVENLGKECGFSDRTNFSRAFAEFFEVGVVEFIENLPEIKEE